MMMTWTDEHIDQWCLRWQTYRQDTQAQTHARALQHQRHQARQEMLTHLHSFLQGQQTLEEFNARFQQQTHSDWNVFGMRGASGGMFLNKLVKYIPQKEQLTQQLRTALQLPKESRDGHHWIQALVLFLEGIIATGQVSRYQLQPARLPFFLSAWWHVQDEEQWPRFAGALRQPLLEGLPLTDTATDQIDLYFAFRERFLALKQAFGVAAWELEHFLLWQAPQEQATPAEKEPVMATAKRPAVSPGKRSRRERPTDQDRRTSLQWMLAQIGKKVGCQVWIAPHDQEHTWNGERLGDLCVPTLPPLAETLSEISLSQLDLLWLRKQEVVAAYHLDPNENEIASCLLRLYDLSIAAAKRPISLCLVLPHRRFEQVLSELARPLFQQQHMRHRCLLIGEEDLLSNGEHILRWASQPDVLEQLASASAQAYAQSRPILPTHLQGALSNSNKT